MSWLVVIPMRGGRIICMGRYCRSNSIVKFMQGMTMMGSRNGLPPLYITKLCVSPFKKAFPFGLEIDLHILVTKNIVKEFFE